MNKRTPTPTSASVPSGDNWYFNSAYIDARLREARFARSQAFGQILADGWHATGRLLHNLLASKPKAMLRHES